MIKDLNKGISNIKYNLLNLPQQIDIKSPVAEAREEYYYSATGEKIAAIHYWNPNYSTSPVIGSDVNVSSLRNMTKVQYHQNLEYDEYSMLLKIKFDNGYYSGTDGKSYIYIKDHLGNIRVIADINGNVAQRTDYDPFGMTMPTSTNQSVQAYKYNGKEFADQAGLNLYDYGARWYDPARAQFTTMDPLAEKYPWMSPYTYCANNPVNRIDPDGRDWYIFDEITGRYNNKMAAQGTHRMAIKSEDKQGNITYTFHDFNDPDVDAKAIENGTINQVEFLSDAKVDEMIDASGVKSSSARIFRWNYALSEGAGKMDYGHRGVDSRHLKKNTFYIRESIAYNLGDIGNYLWGRGMAELGFELGEARIGAHTNNALFGRGQGSNLYDFGEGTYGPPSLLDSPGDQRAIVNGYTNSPAGKAMIEWVRLRNEKLRVKWNQNYKTSFSIY